MIAYKLLVAAVAAVIICNVTPVYLLPTEAPATETAPADYASVATEAPTTEPTPTEAPTAEPVPTEAAPTTTAAATEAPTEAAPTTSEPVEEETEVSEDLCDDLDAGAVVKINECKTCTCYDDFIACRNSCPSRIARSYFGGRTQFRFKTKTTFKHKSSFKFAHKKAFNNGPRWRQPWQDNNRRDDYGRNDDDEDY